MAYFVGVTVEMDGCENSELPGALDRKVPATFIEPRVTISHMWQCTYTISDVQEVLVHLVNSVIEWNFGIGI